MRKILPSRIDNLDKALEMVNEIYAEERAKIDDFNTSKCCRLTFVASVIQTEIAETIAQQMRDRPNGKPKLRVV